MIAFLLNILIVVLILGLLITIHELGHFLAAKLTNTRVDTFAIGMGPKIFGRQFGETHYQLNLLPIGGYVSILGEVVDGEDGDEEAVSSPRSFQNRSVLGKVFILSAGVLMNLMTAVIIYYGFLVMSGFSFLNPVDVEGYEPWFGSVEKRVEGPIYYSEAVKNGNAIKAEWPDTGYIQAIGESEESLEEIETSEQFSQYVQSKKGEQIAVQICDKPADGECATYPVDVSDEGMVGIVMHANVREFVQYEGIERVFGGFVHSANMAQLAGVHIGNIFSEADRSGDYSEAVNTLAGPVGLYFIVDFLRQIGIIGILDLIANLSLTLFIMNLLPIPALDGGRIVLVIVEKLLGDRFNKNIEAWLIRISFVLLMLLMSVILIKDIIYIDVLRDIFA